MLTIRDHVTADLFEISDHFSKPKRQALERSWAGVFRDHLLKHLPVAELASNFSATQGRPSKDLHAVLGALILQQLHDLSDAATVEAYAFNQLWHHALNIRAETDAYLCERTLRNYRRWVIESGLDRHMFRSLTDQLIQAFAVDTRQQRLDSTAIRSCMRTLTRLGIVTEALGKFIRELVRHYPQYRTWIGTDQRERYLEMKAHGWSFRITPSEARVSLEQAGQDLGHLVALFASTEAKALPSYQIMHRVLLEQFTMSPASNGAPAKLEVKAPDLIPSDGVQNPADPDASFNTRYGQGYGLQVMETYQVDAGAEDAAERPASGPDLITHIDVHKLTRHDQYALQPALDDVAQRGVAPERVLADTHYGNIDNLDRTQARGIELVAPVQKAKGSLRGKLNLEQFDLDDAGLIVQCPGGHAPQSVSSSRTRLQAVFSASTCDACPLKPRCLVNTPSSRSRHHHRIQYLPSRLRLRALRLREKTPTFREVYRWRAGIEATMSRLKHQMNLGKLRVRGMASVSYTVFLRALGLNIWRCAAQGA